jgi:ABC-type proline/glycine betaine transport system ATPase subunit
VPEVRLSEVSKRFKKIEAIDDVNLEIRDGEYICVLGSTGSGKTHIMHMNYWQFQAYNSGPHKLDYDNIILVTSDDNMSQQHKEEFRKIY